MKLRESSDHRDTCSGTDHADAMAQRQDSCRSVLRKWNISYRSSDDRSKYRTRNEPVIYSGRMDESDSKKLWYDTVNEANELIDDDIEVDIQGYDADGSVIKIARRNAREAGVDHLIHFQERDVKRFEPPEEIWIYYYEPAIWRKAGR